MKRVCAALSVLALTITGPVQATGGPPVRLFDGESLDGWVKRGGEAVYGVEDGAIVGTSVADTPNTFLCTPRDYGDFELTLQVKVDDGLNSGVQFRSLCFDEPTTAPGEGGSERKVPGGRVHGYQMEIDPSERSWSGGVYDEARRGWLSKPEDDPAARAAFRRGEWNDYRIRCEGPSIRCWVNGVPTADFTDDLTAEGFIALQVHSVREPEQVGKQVRWRNIVIRELD
ncbi:MAG: DUF1080 domain-containing protein [Planctomycetota bacterium]